MGSFRQPKWTRYPAAPASTESISTQTPVLESAQFWTVMAASYLALFAGNQFLGDTALGNLVNMSFSNPHVAEWVGTNAKFLVHPVMDAVTLVGTAGSMLLAIFKPPR